MWPFRKRTSDIDEAPAREVSLPAEPAPLPLPSLGPFSTQEAFDAVANWMSGQGGINDPTIATKWLLAATEDWQSLINIYRTDWLAQKIVRKKPTDLMRPGYSLIWEGSGDKPKKGAKPAKGTSTEADQVRGAVSAWHADQKVTDAMIWAALFGGSIVLIGLKGQQLDHPLPIKDGKVDYSGIKKGELELLETFDRWRANYTGEMDRDPKSPNRGRPLYHNLSGDEGTLSAQQVHWTRVIRFDGAIVPWWTWRANACWHDSVLQVLLEQLKQYGSMTGAISALIPKARRDVIYAVKAAERASTQEGLQKMQNRMGAISRGSSIWNTLMLDKDLEHLEQQTFNFAGLSNIWEKAMKEVAGSTGYPVSILFGDEPAGMNATGDASLRNYYDELASIREHDLRVKHLAILEIITRSTLGYLPDGFSIEYKPFWQPTEGEIATVNKTMADADHIRIQDGVITPGLAAREAKERSLYRTMTQEDVDMAELAVPEPEEEEGPGTLEMHQEGPAKPIEPTTPPKEDDGPGEEEAA